MVEYVTSDLYGRAYWQAYFDAFAAMAQHDPACPALELVLGTSMMLVYRPQPQSQLGLEPYQAW